VKCRLVGGAAGLFDGERWNGDADVMRQTGSLKMKQLVGGLVIGVASLLAAVGCGSSDSGGSSGTPTEKCNAVFEKYCARSATCVTQLKCEPDMSEAQEHDACLSAISTALDCTKAVSVSSSYDACVGKLGAIACSEYGAPPQCTVAELPTECQGVILVSE